MEGSLRPDGELDGDDALAEPHPKLIDNLLEIGVFAIHLVHEKRPRQTHFLGEAPAFLRFNLDARGRRDDDERAIRRGESPFDFADEIRVARGVDEIQLAAVPLDRHQLAADGKAAPQFLRFDVQKRRAVRRASQPLHGSRVKKASVQKARFPGTPVPDNGDIA